MVCLLVARQYLTWEVAFLAGCAGRFYCRALVLVIGYLGQLLRVSVGLADRTRFPVDID